MELVDFAGKHRNQLAFVVGAGPSLHYQDTTALKEFVTFTVNSSVLKIPDCDYFVSDDTSVRDWNYYHRLQDIPCKKLLFEDKLRDAVDHLDADEVVFFKHKIWYDHKNDITYPEGIVMTRDPTQPIVGARTSVGTAVHLAYIMGCDPIVLLGCDACHEGARRYYWEFPGEIQASRLKNANPSPEHSLRSSLMQSILIKPLRRIKKNLVLKYKNRIIQFDDSFGKYMPKDAWHSLSRHTVGLSRYNEHWVDPHSIDFIEYWNAFYSANKNKVTLINASGGILKSFPRVPLETVIETYESRKKISKDDNTAR